ncbi:DUF6705 family protein [Deminuibacter soli]|uniref:DUF6705 domain-containing protein n=1 Tax=Deminuibacter soli TaxID=2291815 RepID=A0A3E1NDM2_9BACT|nr:DUF6705 family protein [Deminuibacter soli]RFM25941.1 hypothetical protein DXN05_22760 [Deminuibacter soli]
MKIIQLLTLLLLCVQLNAQTTTEERIYDTINRYPQFIGKWAWTKDNDSLIFQFFNFKSLKIMSGRRLTTNLVGFFRYVQNGSVVLNGFRNGDPGEVYTIFGSTAKRFINQADLVMHLLECGHIYIGIITFATGDAEHITWKGMRNYFDNIRTPVKGKQPCPVMWPDNLVLTRVRP